MRTAVASGDDDFGFFPETPQLYEKDIKNSDNAEAASELLATFGSIANRYDLLKNKDENL